MRAFNKRFRLVKYYGLSVNVFMCLITEVFLSAMIYLLITRGLYIPLIFFLPLCLWVFILGIKQYKSMDEHRLTLSLRVGKKDIRKSDYYG
jgi:ABC-type transport system involved in multi-copper enzyme maturation permease subunit